MKILIVDDNPDILDILSIIMEQDGHMTKTIDDGNDFNSSIISFQPDLILLDIMLGQYDGRELCSDLKSNITTRHIPVIMISASHFPESFFERGCMPEGFISKPFDIVHVSKTVNMVLTKAQPG